MSDSVFHLVSKAVSYTHLDVYKRQDKDRLSEEINSDVSDESEEEIDSEKHKSDYELLTDTHENEAGDFMVIGDYKFNKKKKVCYNQNINLVLIIV